MTVNEAPLGFTLAVPDRWGTRTDVEGVDLMVVPNDSSSSFRPNLIVVEADEAHDGSLDRYVERQLDGLHATLVDPLLIEVEPRDHRTPELILQAAHRTRDDHHVTFLQRHLLARDGRAVVGTGTAADRDWPLHAGLFNEMLETLTVRYDRPRRARF